MCNWDTIYSVLKLTREDRENRPMEDEKSRKNIASTISISDIKKMGKEELQEGIISYLQVAVPEFGQYRYSDYKDSKDDGDIKDTLKDIIEKKTNEFKDNK